MNQDMTNKGYPYPLYSLDLIIDGSQSKDQQRYYIPIAQGRLVTRPALRARGSCVTTADCNDAVDRGLAIVTLSLDRFATFKLDAGWCDSMRHWQGYMNDLDAARSGGDAEQQLGAQGRQALFAQARDLWQTVTLAAALSGRSGALVHGPLPRAALPFIDAMQGLCARVRDNAELLAENGLTPERQEALFAVTAALAQHHAAGQKQNWTQRTRGDQLGVIRGALIGDLGRLSMVAGRVLSRSAAAGAQMGRLLNRPRRKPAPAQKDSSLTATTGSSPTAQQPGA